MLDNTVNDFLGSIAVSSSPSKKRKRGIGIANLESEFLTVGGQTVEETDDDEDGITGMAHEAESAPPKPPEKERQVEQRRQDNPPPKEPPQKESPQREAARVSQSTPPKQVDISALNRKLDLILRGQKDILSGLSGSSEEMKEDIKGCIKSLFGNLRKEMTELAPASPALVSDADETVSRAEYDKAVAEKESALEFTKSAKVTIESLSQQLSEKETEIAALNEEKSKLAEENRKMRSAIATIAAKNGKTAPAPQAAGTAAPVLQAPPVEPPVPQIHIDPAAVLQTPPVPPPLAQRPSQDPYMTPVSSPIIPTTSSTMPIGGAVTMQQIPVQQIPQYTTQISEPPSVWGTEPPPPPSIAEEEPPKKGGLFHRK